MSSIVVRPARPDEYPAIGQLTVAAYRNDGQLTAGHAYEQVLADVTARASAGRLLVAVDEAASGVPAAGEAAGGILGTVLFVLPGSRYAELCQPGEAEFRTLAVDPAAQGRGIGEALVRACVDLAAQHGCHAVVIYTRDLALAAQRLYARLGFVRTPERDWVPAPGVNLLALRLPLTRVSVQE